MPEQQTIVVTGASSGFGRDTVNRFADAGWRVFATVRDSQGRNAPAARELRARGVQVVELEVTEQASVDAAAADILARGPVDVLVNNAGAAFFGPVEGFTPELARKQFEVNVFAPLRVNRAFLPSMRERRTGLIVYVSSIVGRLVLPFGGVYAASKWAIEALAEATSYELRPFGIDVAIVQPGAFSTNISESRVGPDDTPRLAGYADVLPLAQNISTGLQQAAAGRDSREVAEAIFGLAAMPRGTRPLRTLVPDEASVASLNALAAEVQRGTLADFNLEPLAQPYVESVA
ncbi:MAG TPA: SDR family oxidoreductase [Candidatus Baltobacteraceae bacterium]|jgi:NAD(P)-dependent dehydrogenase (short-subunit alcohol dehydrogenase family)